MKRIIFLIACILAAFLMMLPICAAPSASIDGDSTVSVCETVSFTLTLSGCENGTSYGVSVTYGDKLRLIKGEMARKDGMSIFDISTKKGTFGYTGGKTDLNGSVITLTFKGIEATDIAQNINVQLIVRNGSTELFNQTTSKSVTVSDHTYGAPTQTKAPTCTETGTEVSKCTRCNKEKTDILATVEHSMGSWSTVKNADCEQKGEQERKCSGCSYKETQEINALGHNFSVPMVIKAPTCTEDGVEGGMCTRCQKQATNVLYAKGHAMSDAVTVKEATCTENGLKEGVCSVCGEKTQEAIEAKGHAYGEFVVTKEPSESDVGTKTKTCSLCGDKIEEDIPKLASSQTDVSTAQNENSNQNTSNRGALIWVIISVVIVSAIACVILFISKRK